MSTNFDFCIIGGGIVGLATAFKLQQKHPDKTIAILEKEDRIGAHQTGRNSGVIHSGIYYTPNSYKAKNCKKGRDELVAFAHKYNLNFKSCGKIIVATNEKEVNLLHEIYTKGIANGTPGIQFLSAEEIEEKEPYIKGKKAIWVPSAGIIDYVQVCEQFVTCIAAIQPKSELRLSTRVKAIQGNELHTAKGMVRAKTIICCTGLFADRMAKNDAKKLQLQIVGFRGDYYKLRDSAKHKINNLVYPVPDPNFPFLGVHFTPMVNGDIECGPNAVFSFKREGYHTTSFNVYDTVQALTFRGTLKLFSRHWRKGIDEYKRAFSKRLFVKELQKMMPSIGIDDVVYARAGVRAQALDRDGNLIDDFKIVKKKNHIHVINAPSPAATSCLAIADEIINTL